MLPDNRQAQLVLAKLRQLGIKDVMPFYDHQVQLWSMCQVKQVPKSILTLDNQNLTDVQPLLMWWCRNEKGNYRPPGEQDINDVVATVLRAEKIFEKSKTNPNWLDDQLVKQEQESKAKRKAEQDERLKYIIRNSKIQKHIRKELG